MEECGGKEGGDHEVGGYGLRRGCGSRARGRRRVQLHSSGQAVPMCGLLWPSHHAVFPVQGRPVLVSCFWNFCLIEFVGFVQLGFDSCDLGYLMSCIWF